MEEIRNSPFSMDEDRISNLPEPLIHHILSFLDMKYVVQTCILSRRWRYVWTSVSTLVFSADEFYQDYQPDEDEDVSRSFERFVDSVLMLRDISDIKKFHLYNDCDFLGIKEKQIDRWILAVVRRNVQELHLRLEDYLSALRLPQCLVTSELLTGLVLDFEGELVLPDSMGLPRLKSLFLGSFVIDDLKFVNKLLSSCPVLQTLVIKVIGGRVGDELSVKNRELKHLEIDYLYHESEPRIIRLFTPSLTSFICEDDMVREYCLENLSSLVTANIKLRKGVGDADKQELFAKRMLGFFMAFHNVKELTLALDFLQILSGAPKLIDCRVPQLRNLRCLKLEMHFSSCYLLALTYLLTILPCLESLFITSKEPDSEDDRELVLSGSCKLSHLKYIEIREVKGCKNELIFLECVLKNAPVLEEMVLYFRSAGSSTSLDTKGRRDILNARKKFGEKIKALPRVSPCFIMIFS